MDRKKMNIAKKIAIISISIALMASCTRYIPIFVPTGDGGSDYTEEFRLEVTDRTGSLITLKDESINWASGQLSVMLSFSDPSAYEDMTIYINGEEADRTGVIVTSTPTVTGCVCTFTGIDPGANVISFTVDREGKDTGSLTLTAYIPTYITIRPTI